jgi:hypothetical protein
MEVASMAVFADKSLSWQPHQYHKNIWGSSITRTYETIKLIHFKSQQEMLLKSNNPFAMVILIQLQAYQTKPNETSRLLTKLAFFKTLYKKGWSLATIRSIYLFLEYILCLNEEFEIEYKQACRKIDGGQKMNILLDFEQEAYDKGIKIGEQKGIKIGKLEGEKEGERRGEKKGEKIGEKKGEKIGELKILVNLLKLRFNSIPQHYLSKMESANTDALERWAGKILNAQTIEDVFQD